MGLKRVKMFVLDASVVLALSACASSFPYKYYPYDYDHKTLVGATPKEDLPDKVCESNPQSKQPCTVLMTDIFFKLKADNLKCHSDLELCQHGNPPSQ